MSLLQLHVRVAVLVLLVSETRQFGSVSSSHFGTFDFAELENAAYEVDIASTPMSELQFENDAMHMTILSRHGQRYSCSLPPPPLPPPLSEEEVEEAGKEGRLSSEKLPNVSHLLQPLSERACLIKTVGWWTYEYCHGKFVRQYHMEAGRIVGETKYLGFYERETDWDQNHITRIKGLLDSLKDSLAGAMPRAYHTMYYVNGTECDITHQPRAVQVELYCTVQGIDKLVEIQEGNTCNYTLSVQTPLLCQHPILAPRDDSIARHTLSCTPVLSQLDYEDYLLKQELIKQQKEKLSALQSSDESAESKGSSGSDSDGGSLTSGERQLLRKLVMKSITQLAHIASGSLYDSGYLDDPDGVDVDIELDLDEINDDDIEAAGMGNLKTGNGGGGGGDGEKKGSLTGSREDSRLEGGGRGERSGAGRRQEVRESSQDARADGRVSDKMKKMASDVKTTGRDSALESLLTNLAATAEYIESLENPPQATESAHDNGIPREVADGFQTGDDSQQENTRERSGGDDDASSADVSRVRGPQADDENLNRVRRTDTSSSGKKYVSSKQTTDNEAAQNYGGGGGGGTTVGSEWATAGKGKGETRTEDVEEEEENVQELDQLDPELVREMEQQMEKTLGRQLDTDAEIKVKIITIQDDRLKELTEEVEREGKEGREGDGGDKESVEADSDLSETVASAVSRLLDRLLNDENDSVYEDKIKQSDLEDSYDQVWGDRRKERRNNGR